MIVLPWSPGLTTNHIYRNGGRGGRVLTDAARDWRREAVDRIVMDWGPIRATIVPDGPLSISIRIYPPRAVKPDVDGTHKVIVDAVAEALDIDDNRFTSIHIYRYASVVVDPRFEIMVSRDEEAAQEQTRIDLTKTKESDSDNFPFRLVDASGQPVPITPVLRRALTAVARRRRR